MSFLHLAGFEIPTVRGGVHEGSDELGAAGMGITGTPIGGHIATTEAVNVTTPLIPLATARAIESLCRAKNGACWHCDNSIYASSGLAMADTPTFQTGTKQFGTHAISITAAAGDIAVVTVGSLYTVAAWTKVGSGDWEHQILRSDGAQWVDGVRSDMATLVIDVATSVFTLLDDGASTSYFDDLVWLPFEIADSWGPDWPLTEAFSDLPKLNVTGDMLSGYRVNAARARARIVHEGYAGSFSGQSAVVQLDIVGPEREVDA